MLDTPNPNQPNFGLLVNGREFFLKLIQTKTNHIMLGLMRYQLNAKMNYIRF